MPRRTATHPERLTDLAGLLLQAEGMPEVLDALRQGHSATVDGAWGSSAGLVCATLARHAPHTLLVVTAHPRELDIWAGDLASFSGAEPAVFPAWDSRPAGGLDEVAGQRLRVLRRLQEGPPGILLTTIQALLQPVPEPGAMALARRTLRRGAALDLEELVAWLVAQGYASTEVVEAPGELARRGGILDVFSPDSLLPCRIELFGDEIDSLRTFVPETQRSEQVLDSFELSGTGLEGGEGRGMTGHLCDHLPAGAWTVLVEVEELHDQGRQYLARVSEQEGLFGVAGCFEQLVRFPSVKVAHLPSPTVEAACHLRVESVERFSGDVRRVREELDAAAGRDLVLIACQNEAECQRLEEVLTAGELARHDRLRLTTGQVASGFRLVGTEAGSVVVLGGQELFHRDVRPEARAAAPRRRAESRAIDSFVELSPGDLVVHISHGIARYQGMQLLQRSTTGGRAGGGQLEEHLILEFRDGVKVYVPASRIDLVQKYIGGAGAEPELSKYGGTSWQSRKARVEEAVKDLAADMIQLQAAREAQPGLALPPDTDWQAAFEASFPFRETPDQLTSLAEIKADLQRPRPMDRLICGDVGYGKTELAMRAAFKVVDNGRQVAVLVPTTVLAEQHYRTFGQRLAEYPFAVECLSRFRSHAEQRRILQRLGQGGVDVIIGTHRLLSKDVAFKDLGLVIIDEEQRFGVEHKERLKKLRTEVDVLTMTATPIPRTLHLALLGIRDISNLETPPADRHAIETRIVRFDPELIRQAILRELNREGQIYFVHNRVQSIHAVTQKLAGIVPEARYTIVHGQMDEHELERNMLKFVRREADVLVATTIIESGLDIPSANTIFIHQADMYGLADLHQLRGRVGRYKHRAHAYMLLDGDKLVTGPAARRLKAIEELTDLGAGFKIALRDLEIRGAGNILGTQQSGHIAAVGYELYCQLLENAVRTLRQLPRRTPLEVAIDLPWTAYFPHTYVPSHKLRIEAYRRLARVRQPDRLADLEQELRDRYGPLPEPAVWLVRLAEMRILASAWKLAGVHLEKITDSSATDVVLSFRDRKRISILEKRSGGRLRVIDEGTAYFRLHPRELLPGTLYDCLKGLLAREG